MVHDTTVFKFWLEAKNQKAIFNYVLTAFLFIPALLIMTIIAAAIKLDSPGPVLFTQRRQGLNNRDFTIFKFRTMLFSEDSNTGEISQVMLDDERVTRVGRFLRLTGLDELPQLINVLKGEMSLIGPRPHLKALDQKYCSRIKDYNKRHNVKPGITGWAQVNGSRGDADSPEKMKFRIEHDLFYIDNWSIFLDLKIFLMTILMLLGTFAGFLKRNDQR